MMRKFALKLLTIVGARPQFVKVAVVSRAIAEHNQLRPNCAIKEVMIHTGQHYDADMSAVFFAEMDIPEPAYNLGVGSGMHGAMTGRMLEQIEAIITKEKPAMVVVYGDTNSTLAGALAAAKLSIPIVHVEAGLRSFVRSMPEEVNRVLADHLSSILFCPTLTAMKHLTGEGIVNGRNGCRVECVGDVMLDAFLFYQAKARRMELSPELEEFIHQRFFLATLHRADNIENETKFRDIVRGLEALAQSAPVLLPLHPRTKKALLDRGLSLQYVTAVNPLGYFEILRVLDACSGVFTDSGGLQKEACFANKPCAILRTETEWVELLDSGSHWLVGHDPSAILDAGKKMTTGDVSSDVPERLFGFGDAGHRIVASMVEYLEERSLREE